VLIERQTAAVTAVRFQVVHQMQQKDKAVRTEVCQWFRLAVREGVHAYWDRVLNGTFCINSIFQLLERKDKLTHVSYRVRV
jgi:hypothetical protein